MTYDLLPNETLITKFDKGKLVLTNQRLGISTASTKFINLQYITSIEITIKRKLLVLIPGILLAPLYVFYQIGTGTGDTDVGSLVLVCVALILGSIIRYYIFPDKTLLIKMADSAVAYPFKGIDDEDMDGFIESVKNEMVKAPVPIL